MWNSWYVEGTQSPICMHVAYNATSRAISLRIHSKVDKITAVICNSQWMWKFVNVKVTTTVDMCYSHADWAPLQCCFAVAYSFDAYWVRRTSSITKQITILKVNDVDGGRSLSSYNRASRVSLSLIHSPLLVERKVIFRFRFIPMLTSRYELDKRVLLNNSFSIILLDFFVVASFSAVRYFRSFCI